MRLIVDLLISLGLIFFAGCNIQTQPVDELSNTDIRTVEKVSATDEGQENLYLLKISPEPTLLPTQGWILEEMEFGEEKIGVIVEALETYKSEFGDYPSSLAKLVPNYLPVMPLTLAGEPFSYTRFENIEYGVYFVWHRESNQYRTVYCGQWLRTDGFGWWECSGTH